MNATPTIEAIKRACRMCKTNAAAAEQLGIAPSSMGRMCKRMGIESPQERTYRIAKGG